MQTIIPRTAPHRTAPHRIATLSLQRLAKGFPIIALTGPRQSGKTTQAREVFADKAYVSLENPDEHEFAEHDPRAFLNRFGSGAILDEVQRCPHLLSWLQGMVDERGRMGDFILTGSSQPAAQPGGAGSPCPHLQHRGNWIAGFAR